MTAIPSANPVVRLTVELQDGSRKTFLGRDAWALDQLISAGMIGVTPIERPAPRWSHYIFKLRRGGVPVETVTECHGGAYAGSHARYVLKAALRVVESARQHDRAAKPARAAA